MNYQFTDEDKLIPIYCIGCRQHIPRTVSKSNRGLCPVCVAKIQATPSIAPPPAQPTPPPPNPQYQQHQPGYYQPAPPKPMSTGGIIGLVLVCTFCICPVGFGLIGNLNGNQPKPADSANSSVEDIVASKSMTEAEKQEAADKALRPADSANSSQQERVSTTPIELVRFFSENAVKAKDWASGKEIQITAPVYSVGNNMFGGDRVCVQFEAKTGDFLNPKVEFWYSGSFRSEVGNLKAGQIVTCVGTFKEQQFGGDIQLIGLDLK